MAGDGVGVNAADDERRNKALTFDQPRFEKRRGDGGAPFDEDARQRAAT